MTVFEINVVGDVVCPWCYLGLRRLQRAISLYRHTYPSGRNDEFRIRHVPYLLGSVNSQPSEPIQKRMRDRMGEERSAKVREHLTNLGRAEGIVFKFGGNVGPTRDAHRLVQLAMIKDAESPRDEEQSFEDEVVEGLYHTYFEEQRDVSEEDVLVEVGLRSRLGTEEDLRAWLKNDGGGKAVDEQFEKIKAEGIKGVPQVQIQGTHWVEGAEDPGAFYEIFTKIKEEEIA